tara:strand:+ start:427 stop:774 length:348 start_codon:yes stop_codon:yes gene_type:complete
MNTRYLFGLPFVTINIKGKEIEAILDTGFNGYLMIPTSIIENLSLEKIGRAQYALADGQSSDCEIYLTEIEFVGKIKKVAVVSSPSDFALLGMELLKDVKTTLFPEKEILKIELG